MRGSLALLLAVTVASASVMARPAAALTINLTFGPNFTDPMQQAVAQAAAQLWMNAISGPPFTVDVIVEYADLTSNSSILAQTIDNVQTSSPNAETGTQLPQSARIQLNSNAQANIQFYFDSTPGDDSEFNMSEENGRFGYYLYGPASWVDALSALVHEMGHAVGFWRENPTDPVGQPGYTDFNNNFQLSHTIADSFATYSFDYLTDGSEGNVTGAGGARTTVPFSFQHIDGFSYDGFGDTTLYHKLMAVPGFRFGERSLPTALDIDIIADAFHLGINENYRRTVGVGDRRIAMQSNVTAAYPSPTRGPLTINFSLASAAHASLRIFDASGRLVRLLTDGWTSPGAHTIRWKGEDERGVRLSPGVYFLQLRADGSPKGQRRFVVVR